MPNNKFKLNTQLRNVTFNMHLKMLDLHIVDKPQIIHTF